MTLAGELMKLASPDDASDALGLLADADAWAKAQGLSQWHGQDLPRQMRDFISRGELFIHRDPHRSLLAMMVLQGSPDHYWEVPDDGRAFYTHKLAVRADLRGTGLGARCLAWGEEYARAQGREFMRLDCLAANPKLRAYYPRLGYRFVGEVDSEAFQIRMALFEKNLTERVRKSPGLID